MSFEDRQDLLGHKSSRMTTHYSAAELEQLILAANKACDKQSSSVTLELMRRRARSCAVVRGRDPHNFPTVEILGSRKSGLTI